MEIEMKTNNPFDYENVIVVISINSTDGCELTAEVFAMYKESQAREMLLEDFDGAGEEASIHVDNLLKKGYDVVKMGTTTKFFTCRTGKLMTKKVNEISEKSKDVLRSKGWNGACDVNSVAHLVSRCGYDVDAYYFFQEQKYAFRMYELDNNEEACIGCRSDYHLRFDSPFEEEDGLLYDTINEAYEAGVNYAVENYIANGDFDFSKV